MTIASLLVNLIRIFVSRIIIYFNYYISDKGSGSGYQCAAYCFYKKLKVAH